MAESRAAEIYKKKEVQDHIIRELRKRIREDRPAEKIRDLSILGLEEQIERNERHLDRLRAELGFIADLDLSLLETE